MHKILLLVLYLPFFAHAGECNFDSNQADRTRCAINEYSTAHDVLERNVGRVEYCLRIDLVKDHEVWKNIEKTKCAKELALGGSIATQIFYACMLEGTNNRIKNVREKAPACFK